MKVIAVILVATLLIGGLYVYVSQSNVKTTQAATQPATTNPGAVASRPGRNNLIRENTANSVQIGVEPLSLRDQEGNMVFGIGFSTHSVDLSQYKLDKITRVVIDGVVVEGPTTWVAESDDPHHRAGQLKVSAVDKQGKPRVSNQTKVMKVEITGLAGGGVRTFEWADPLRLMADKKS